MDAELVKHLQYCEANPGYISNLGLSPKGLLAILRRDWAVRVLDMWKSRMHGRTWRADPVFHTDQFYGCTIEDSHGSLTRYQGVSEDAARLSAAKAVFSTLDKTSPTWPGECP